MEVHLPECGRLARLPKILKSKASALGIEITLSASRELVAKMLGFASWNSALRNMRPELGMGWDDAVDEKTRIARDGQAELALIESGLFARDAARTLVKEVGTSRRPGVYANHDARTVVHTNAFKKWTAYRKDEISEHFDDVSDEVVWVRRISSADLHALNYSEKGAIEQLIAKVPDADTLVCGFRSGKDYNVFGHVHFSAKADVERLRYQIEVHSFEVERFCDLGGDGWTNRVLAYALKDAIARGKFWVEQENVERHDVEIVITPPLDEWRRPALALEVETHFGTLADDDDYGYAGGSDRYMFSGATLARTRKPSRRLPSARIENFESAAAKAVVEKLRALFGVMGHSMSAEGAILAGVPNLSRLLEECFFPSP